MSKPATTMREALAQQSLEEIDGLVTRVEGLIALVNDAGQNMQATAAALGDAGDKYRMAVTAFTEQAKADLVEHVQLKGSEVAARSIEEQRAAMQEAARLAFRSQASDQAEGLAGSLSRAAADFRKGLAARLLENGGLALGSSALTGAIVYGLMKMS